MDSPNYRGRIGAKGLSLQPTGSLAGHLGAATGPVTGLATPFRSTKHPRGGSIGLQKSRMSKDQVTSLSNRRPIESIDEDHLMQEILDKHLDPS